MQEQDCRSFDWDDSELVKAYNRGLKGRQAKENKKTSKPKDNRRRKWNIGDNCRAIYPLDKLYYEAKIINVNGDFCTVEFLGYGDTEDVDFLELKESEGKKARKKQIKAAMADVCDLSSSMNESETGNDVTDVTVTSHNSPYRKKKYHVKHAVDNTTMDTTTYEATFHHQCPVAADPAHFASHLPHPPPMPTNVPFMPPHTTIPQYSAPPAPPMPQCLGIANNPTLAAMLSSWYLAGYYSGIHSAQKENQGCQRYSSHCGSHSNQCCHH